MQNQIVVLVSQMSVFHILPHFNKEITLYLFVKTKNWGVFPGFSFVLIQQIQLNISSPKYVWNHSFLFLMTPVTSVQDTSIFRWRRQASWQVFLLASTPIHAYPPQSIYLKHSERAKLSWFGPLEDPTILRIKSNLLLPVYEAGLCWGHTQITGQPLFICSTPAQLLTVPSFLLQLSLGIKSQNPLSFCLSFPPQTHTSLPPSLSVLAVASSRGLSWPRFWSRPSSSSFLITSLHYCLYNDDHHVIMILLLCWLLVCLLPSLGHKPCEDMSAKVMTVYHERMQVEV